MMQSQQQQQQHQRGKAGALALAKAIRTRTERLCSQLAPALNSRLAPALVLVAGLGFLPVGTAADKDLVQRDPVEWGREIAYGAGNCSSCHAMSTDESDTLAGNLGPVLVAMRVRYPNFEQLRTQIYNAAAKNPTSTMPPYGSHKILTEEEIDAVTAFVWEL